MIGGFIVDTLYACSWNRLHPDSLEERTEKDGLYPIQALVQPVALRFKYHFEGTRQTNRLDKVCIYQLDWLWLS